MTIYEQELTLFGGWAKVQTHLPIEIGYPENLDMPLSSKNTESLGESITVYFYNDYAHAVHWVDMYSFEVLVDTWKHMALLRFLEAWKYGTTGDMIRGLAGTKKLFRSFCGLIGCQNDSVHEPGALAKNANGRWTLSGKKPLYPQIHRIPLEGIQNIRKYAQKLRDQRRHAARQARFERN